MSDTPNPRRSTRKASQPLRLIHAGLGGWGRDWLKVVRAEPGVRTVAWVEPDERSREAAVQAGVPEGNLHPTLAAALAAGAADALLITAPAAAHVPLALEGLSAGLHVLTEKPFAPSVAEARQAIEAADRAGRVLMVSQNYRHHPAPRAARALVASGELGRVGVVNVDFRFDLTGRPANPYLTSYQPL
ncbi:MAG TPA: Gfo/Idh/MocA family oxidoreductase, partial [Deinococcales bacterium]|nr:Gfo/Idh/MocA family oxidoreductase [Deinococcales bacterium]